MLGSNAFQGCLNLTEVHFNDGMQIIGPGTFCDCKALRSVAVPATVRGINYFEVNFVRFFWPS